MEIYLVGTGVSPPACLFVAIYTGGRSPYSTTRLPLEGAVAKRLRELIMT